MRCSADRAKSGVRYGICATRALLCYAPKCEDVFAGEAPGRTGSNPCSHATLSSELAKRRSWAHSLDARRHRPCRFRQSIALRAAGGHRGHRGANWFRRMPARSPGRFSEPWRSGLHYRWPVRWRFSATRRQGRRRASGRVIADYAAGKPGGALSGRRAESLKRPQRIWCKRFLERENPRAVACPKPKTETSHIARLPNMAISQGLQFK